MGLRQNNSYYLRLDMRNPRLLDEAGVLGLVILFCEFGEDLIGTDTLINF